jgi:hypothetical protein
MADYEIEQKTSSLANSLKAEGGVASKDLAAIMQLSPRRVRARAFCWRCKRHNDAFLSSLPYARKLNLFFKRVEIELNE